MSSNKLAATVRTAKYMKAYYRKHRKKLLKRAAAYQQEHREEIAAYMLEYQRKNRKKKVAYDVAYIRENRKKIAKKRAAYYQKNHKEIAKRQAVQCRKITSRYGTVLRRHKYQLAPRGIKGQPMSLADYQKKLYYADGRERPCWYCLGENNKAGTGLDRLHNNTTYVAKNTVPACCGCNTWRGYRHTVQETRDHFKPMRDASKLATGVL